MRTPLPLRPAFLQRGARILPVLALMLAIPPAPRAQSQDSPLISIRLEQKQGDIVRIVPQNTVFRSGEILRFRLTSHMAGYLYVVDRGTSGEIDTLFPAPGAAPEANRIEPGQDNVVPAMGDGWFQVAGPSGFDILYFLLSANPIILPGSAASAEPQNTEPPPPELLPRCDDSIFRARGDCVDPSAGVAPLKPGAPIPRELVPLARTASRDIILTDDGGSTAVRAAAKAKLPLIYTFRLAHRE